MHPHPRQQLLTRDMPLLAFAVLPPCQAHRRLERLEHELVGLRGIAAIAGREFAQGITQHHWHRLSPAHRRARPDKDLLQLTESTVEDSLGGQMGV